MPFGLARPRSVNNLLARSKAFSLLLSSSTWAWRVHMALVSQFLAQLSENRQHLFVNSQSIMSFNQYLEDVVAKPGCHIRNSGQYFADMIDSFGSYEVVTPIKTTKRYRVFDADFTQGEGRVFGQDSVMEAIVSQISNFVRAGRIDKLLLLHGPNGSAKTSLIHALAQAAEYYSLSPEGSLYQFSWVFPHKESVSGSLGFSSKTSSTKPESYAFLNNDAVDALVVSEQSDHPLLLLSVPERLDLFNRINKHKIPDVLQRGELSHKNRQIFDALLASYHGDISEVLRHIRVERFYYSRRYKKGMSVVEPQMSVDAFMRQLTADQSLLAIPSSLRHLSLYEVSGPLIEANRGLIEYSDLLKRPIDAWKYLLVACEQAQVSVGTLSVFFDLLLIATSNELHLNSFKEYPDWPSFKGRIELIRVPYLLRSHDELGIYQTQIPRALSGMHIAPHAIALAARWAVLTRLEPPSVAKYPAHVQEIIRDLSPEEKLDLYNDGEVPLRLSQRQARDLKAHIGFMAAEYQHDANYEGRFGASPREIRTLILNAAHDQRFDHVSVGAIFDQIEQLIEEKSSFDFLRREYVRGYRDSTYLLQSVKTHYQALLADEARMALGLFSKESYIDLFARYVMHVSAWTKKERLLDPLLGRKAEADESFMKNLESKLLAANESNDEFRRQLISQIGAYKLENPQLELNYAQIFSSHLRRLKESIYQEQQVMVERIIRVFLKFSEHDHAAIDEREVNYAKALKEGLIKLGYQESSARWAMAYLLKEGQTRSLSQPSLNF